eukprot:9331851-Karenia_brevis.AAC.1
MLTMWKERWRSRKVLLDDVDVPTAGFYDWSAGLSTQSSLASDWWIDPKARSGTKVGLGPETSYGRWLVEEVDVRQKTRSLRRRTEQDERRHNMCEVELQSYVPPVESVWTDSKEYKTVLQGRWRWDQEHINIKEGR